MIGTQWSRWGSYCLWQVCLLWFVCEGPRQTPKGMLLPNPAQGVWPWSPATTPRVDSLPWRNSLVSTEPWNFPVSGRWGLPSNHRWKCRTQLVVKLLHCCFDWWAKLIFCLPASFFSPSSLSHSLFPPSQTIKSLLPVGELCFKPCSTPLMWGLWAWDTSPWISFFRLQIELLSKKS